MLASDRGPVKLQNPLAFGFPCRLSAITGPGAGARGGGVGWGGGAGWEEGADPDRGTNRGPVAWDGLADCGCGAVLNGGAVGKRGAGAGGAGLGVEVAAADLDLCLRMIRRSQKMAAM